MGNDYIFYDFGASNIGARDYFDKDHHALKLEGLGHIFLPILFFNIQIPIDITMSPLEGKACKYSYCVPNCALFHFLDKNRTKIGGHSIYHIHN